MFRHCPDDHEIKLLPIRIWFCFGRDKPLPIFAGFRVNNGWILVVVQKLDKRRNIKTRQAQASELFHGTLFSALFRTYCASSSTLVNGTSAVGDREAPRS